MHYTQYSCSNCGMILSGQATKCPRCGVSLRGIQPGTAEGRQSREAAFQERVRERQNEEKTKKAVEKYKEKYRQLGDYVKALETKCSLLMRVAPEDEDLRNIARRIVGLNSAPAYSKFFKRVPKNHLTERNVLAVEESLVAWEKSYYGGLGRLLAALAEGMPADEDMDSRMGMARVLYAFADAQLEKHRPALKPNPVLMAAKLIWAAACLSWGVVFIIGGEGFSIWDRLWWGLGFPVMAFVGGRNFLDFLYGLVRHIQKEWFGW